MKMKKRFLGILLSLVMVLGLVPGLSMTAYAEEGVFSGSGTEDDPYIISDAADWEAFANHVNNNTDDGKYVGAYYKLADNFDNSGDAITAMVGTEAHPFQGTFDGNGRTMNLGISTSDGGAAPFHYINGATIRNLNVTGSVDGDLHTAAIVGFSNGTNNRIEDCVVAATIGGGSSHAGGILGHGGSSDIAIERCVFSGLMTAGSSARGAIFGWGDEGGTKSITDCLYVMADGQDTSNLDIVKQNKGSVTVTRCYKTTDAGVYGTQVFTAAPADRIYCRITAADGNQYYVCATTEVKSYYLYTGSDIPVAPVVKNAAGETLTAGTDYTYEPTTVNAVGEHTLTVTGKGSYAGSQSLSFIVTDGTVLTSETTELTTGIYKLTGDVTIGSRIEVTGDVTLLLSDGFTLNATKGIHVKSGHSLTINGGANNTGKLIATNVDNCRAGIGGNDGENCGTIIINGGTLDIRGGLQAAGIGGGMNGSGSNITINGGTVTAYGGSESGAGIGGGKFGSGRDITISGGTVLAYGGASDWGELDGSGGASYGTGGAAGIGGGWGGSGSNITISGGTVTAAGGCGLKGTGGGAGIGGGFRGKGSNITISGGSVKPSSHYGAYDIGCGNWGGFAVIPTDGNGNNVYPMVIHNPSGGQITINGNAFPCTHHGSEKVVYPFLPNERQTVVTEGTSATYIWDGSAWVVDETFTADGTLTQTSIVSDTTWTIEAGKTITVDGGISIANGVSFTVVGEGTLIVKAPNGDNCVKSGLEHWIATSGGAAISGGTLIVNGATVNATGGNGGNGIDDTWAAAATGGNGGNAISSNVRIYAGEVNATGGDGGNLAACPNGNPEAGNGGNGIVGRLTVNGGTVNAKGGNSGKNGINNFVGQGGTGIGASTTIKNGTVTATGGTGYSGESGNAFGSVPTLAEGSTLTALQAGENSGSVASVEINAVTGKRYAHIEASGEFATGVELSPTSASLRTGMNTLLTAKVLPEGTSANSVAWSSSNEAVATVGADGLVTGVADGTAIITATATNGTADTSDDFSASCEVTVIGGYPVWVGGEQVWKDVPSGTGWSYNPDSKTLTLSGYSYSGTGYNNRAIYAEGELNIVLTGENTVAITNSTGNGIYVQGNLTIGGEGTLSASGPNFGLFTNGGNITINSGTVTATAEQEAAIRSNGGGVLINGGTVTATEPHRGISASNSVQISGGTVVATGTDSSGWGIDCPGGSFTVTGGEFTTSGGKSAINGNPSMTIGKGLSVFAGDEAPGIDVTATFASSHAQKWVHIRPSHKHSFTYEQGTGENANTITATCANSDGYCPLPNKQAALTIVAPARTTYGGSESAEATIEGSIDGVENPSIVYKKGDATLPSVPTDAGTYTASITLGEATASVEYTIAKADPTANAPTGLIATYGQTLADVALANPADNTLGSWAWADAATTSVGSVGAHTFKANFTPTDTMNYNSKSNVDVTVTVGKADSPATVASTATVTKGGNTVDLAGNVTKNGATGDVSYAISSEANGCSLSGSVLTSGDTTGTVTVNVTVATDDNYNALAATSITVTISDKATQTITASDVTATYGDTGKSVSASVTVPATSGGTISYAVKPGSEDYIDVASDGKLTIRKVPASGKAYVIVKAAATDDYAETTKEVTVTISKATVTITAKDQSIYVDGTVPTLSGADFYTVTGLVGTDTLTTAPTLAYQKNGSAATPDNTTTGTYDIVASGASAGDNYAINYTKGTLTISSQGGGGSYTPSTPSDQPSSGDTGDTPTEEAYTVPVESTNTVQVETSITGGTAKISEITADDITRITDTSSAGSSGTAGTTNTISINLSGSTQTVNSVELTKTTVEALSSAAADKSNNVNTVTVHMTNATVELDAKTLETVSQQAEGDSIRLVVADTVAETHLNQEQKQSVASYSSAFTFEAYFESGESRIHDFGGGTAKVSVKYSLGKGMLMKYLHLLYLALDGATEYFPTSYADGWITSKLSHFSDYAIVYDETLENENADPYSGMDTEAWDADESDFVDDDSTVLVNGKTASANGISINSGLKLKQSGSTLSISWGKVSGATGYKIFAGYCGPKMPKTPVKIIKGSSKTSFTIKKLNGKPLKLKKNYKVYVLAYKTVEGVDKVLGRTVTAHVVGKRNKKYSNPAKLTIQSSKNLKLKVGKTSKIKARVTLVDPKKKSLSDHHAPKFRYASTDKNVATVTNKGKIKAVREGSCYIWVYAKNGYAKKIKVTVS